MQRTALFVLAISALLIIACGGGSSGSVRYAPTVVPINHVDLSAIELSFLDTINPPFVERYPLTVR